MLKGQSWWCGGGSGGLRSFKPWSWSLFVSILCRILCILRTSAVNWGLEPLMKIIGVFLHHMVWGLSDRWVPILSECLRAYLELELLGSGMGLGTTNILCLVQCLQNEHCANEPPGPHCQSCHLTDTQLALRNTGPVGVHPGVIKLELQKLLCLLRKGRRWAAA